LRWIDVLDDLAFPVMDLLAHGRRDLAFRLLDGWLEASGDHEGLRALRFFLVMRALVRSQVAALRESPPSTPATACSADAYLRLGDRSRGRKRPPAADHPRTARVGQDLPVAGAARVGRRGSCPLGRRAKAAVRPVARSSPRASVPGTAVYGAPATQATYDRLLAAARASLEGGWPTIVDAAFLKRGERAEFAALAAASSAPFTILDCRGSLPLLRRRIEARQRRGGDASEADVAVLDRLSTDVEPLDARESGLAIAVEAAQPTAPIDLTERWLCAL
jgi:predicted kinase